MQGERDGHSRVAALRSFAEAAQRAWRMAQAGPELEHFPVEQDRWKVP